MELLGGGPVNKTPCTRAEVERPFKATGETLSNSRSPCTLLTCSCTLNTVHLRGFQAQRHFCTTLQTWDNSITVANKHWKNTEMCIGLANLKLFGPKRLLLTELQTCSLSSILYVQMWTNIIWVEVNLGNKSLLYWSSWVSALCARASNESHPTNCCQQFKMIFSPSAKPCDVSNFNTWDNKSSSSRFGEIEVFLFCPFYVSKNGPMAWGS